MIQLCKAVKFLTKAPWHTILIEAYGVQGSHRNNFHTGKNICIYIYIFVRNKYTSDSVAAHDDTIKWKHFPRYWSFVSEIHRSPVVPLTKASNAEFWYFLLCAPEQTVKKTIEMLVIWDATALIVTLV